MTKIYLVYQEDIDNSPEFSEVYGNDLSDEDFMKLAAESFNTWHDFCEEFNEGTYSINSDYCFIREI